MQQDVSSSRMVSLDVLRGLTIAGMILVNNPGSWSYLYAPLDHAEFNGLTPTDLVFPFFMFIMGFSMFLSMKRKQSWWKILRRTVTIFLIGTAIGVLARLAFGNLDFSKFRILGVLQRLALSYGLGALFSRLIPSRRWPLAILLLLVSYAAILLLGHGFELSEENIVGIVDRAILGENHMYHMSGVALDPEGLLSTIPCVAHVLLGAWVACKVDEAQGLRDKVLRLSLLGSALLIVGWLLSYGIPVNKKIWSPTFVLVSCGGGSMMLALFMWLLDVWGQAKGILQFFAIFGRNPMAMFVFSDLLCIFLIWMHWNAPAFHFLQGFLGNYPASLCYAILNVLACWLVAFWMYRKHLIWKV